MMSTQPIPDPGRDLLLRVQDRLNKAYPYNRNNGVGNAHDLLWALYYHMAQPTEANRHDLNRWLAHFGRPL
jgi:hypothetical protein